MVGTIYGLGLSQQQDADGDPLVGCKLYLYEAGTSTPVTTYSDYGLTSGNELTHPIIADAAGRLPAFWVADGSYRVRLTDSDGNEIFDESSITALGASTGAASGGGVSTQILFQTGDMICTFDEGTREGWIRMYGTIGNTASGASNRANADCEALFAFLWNKVSDTYAPVTGGRGASAAADFAASRSIQIPDMQGRCFIGLDDMAGGSPAAGVVAAAVESAYSGGLETVTIAETNLPAHTHGSGTLTVADHTHAAGTYAVGSHTHEAGSYAAVSHTHDSGSYAAEAHNHGVAYRNNLTTGGLGLEIQASPGSLTGTQASGPHSVDGTSGATAPAVAGTSGATAPSFTGASAGASPAVDSGVTGATGSGTALASMNPYRAGSWYIKL
jgi:hypothetical protein